MTNVIFIIKDLEIKSNEIDRLIKENSGDSDKTTTTDGWSYNINFNNGIKAQNFIIKLLQDYPKLDFEWHTIK